jgi:hypothetical protein
MSDACPNCATLTQALSDCLDEVARRDAALRLALGIAVDAEAMVFRVLSEVIADLFAGSVHERPTQSELGKAGDTERPGPLPFDHAMALEADATGREVLRSLTAMDRLTFGMAVASGDEDEPAVGDGEIRAEAQP